MLRATAISLVVLFHATPLLEPLTVAPIIGKPTLYIMKILTWLGPISVDLFFSLSGFLIGTILIKVFLTTGDYKIRTVWEFWIKRWFRTLPNYIFLVTIGFLLYKALYNYPVRWQYYVFIQNFSRPIPSFFGETWSLAVEEWTYLLLPIAVLIAFKLFQRGDKSAILKYTFILYAIISFVIRFFKVTLQDYTNLDEQIRKVTLFRLDAIIYGVIMAYLVYYYKPIMLKYKLTLFFIGIVGVSATLIWMFLALHFPGMYLANRWFKILTDSFFYALIPFFFSLFIPISFFFTNSVSNIFTKAVTHISLISYSLYLIHNSLVFVPFFLPLANSSHSFASLTIYFLFYLFIVTVLSTLNYYYFEKPTTRWRELFIKKSDKSSLKV